MGLQSRLGTGKPILASILIKRISDQTDNNMFYFYCKAGETEKQETTHRFANPAVPASPQ